MSYQTRVDEMVGKHVAEFQDEMTLGKLMARYVEKTPSMPYGYPIAVYCPLHTCKSPEIKHFVARTGGRMSNGVPKVISMDVVDQYILGLYNPAHS